MEYPRNGWRLLAIGALLMGGCKDQNGSQKPNTEKPAAPNIDAAPHGSGPGITRRKGAFSGRNAPELFQRAANSGLLLASCGDEIIWVERRGQGNVLVGAKISGDTPRPITKATPSIRDIACDAKRVVWTAEGVGTNTVGKNGLYQANRDGSNQKRIAEITGKIALDGDEVYVLVPGAGTKAGEVWKVSAEKPTRLATNDEKFGRSSIAAHNGVVYVLGDRRIPLPGNKGKIRTGFIKRVASDGTISTLTDAIYSPGTQLIASGDRLFFTGTQKTGTHRGLYSIPQAGGEPTLALAAKWEVARFGVTSDAVFAVAMQEGWKLVRKLGDAEGFIAETERAPASHLVIAGDHVYFAASGQINRVATNKPAVK